MLDWVVPEVEAETEIQMQGDIWEAILSSMTQRWEWNKEGKEADMTAISSK